MASSLCLDFPGLKGRNSHQKKTWCLSSVQDYMMPLDLCYRRSVALHRRERTGG